MKIILATAPLVLFASCGAGLYVQRIPLAEITDANGLIVNVNVPHRVVAVFPETPDSGELESMTAELMLPSPQEVYEVNYEGALFSTKQLEVDLHPDSTIKRLKLSSTNNAVTDLEALTESVSNVKSEIEEYEKSKEEDPIGAENEQLQKEFLNLMLQQNIQAAEAGLTLPFPSLAD